MRSLWVFFRLWWDRLFSRFTTHFLKKKSPLSLPTIFNGRTISPPLLILLLSLFLSFRGCMKIDSYQKTLLAVATIIFFLFLSFFTRGCGRLETFFRNSFLLSGFFFSNSRTCVYLYSRPLGGDDEGEGETALCSVALNNNKYYICGIFFFRFAKHSL